MDDEVRGVMQAKQVNTNTLPTSPTSRGLDDDPFIYIAGWRLHAVTAGLSLGIFLVNFELTIVSTALVNISNDFQSFNETSWVITSYLITYVAGFVLWAKLSDIIGRKRACIATMVIFVAFSGGCGAAQTMTQLIICRAFQGIGGSGIYAVTMVMLYELVPKPKYPQYTAIVSSVLALGFLLGPVFGGLIAEYTTWRWVFLLNIPAGTFAGLLLFLTVPNDFPNNGREKLTDKKTWRSIDFVGGFLILATLALVISGLEEAASSLSWVSAQTLAPICASSVTFAMFLASQYRATRPGSIREPVFPWRFLTDRVTVGLILFSFTTGAVNVTCIFEIPLRHQAAADLSPLQTGLRLLPLAAGGPLGTILCAALSKKRRMPPLYVSFIGQALQIIGLVMLARGPADNPNWTALYGFEVLVGFGFGFCIGTATLLTPFIVENRDLATGTGAVFQMRFTGGAIVISIITAVGNSSLKSTLSESLTPEQLGDLLRSTRFIEMFPLGLQSVIRGAFVDMFNLQMHIVLGFAVAAVFTSFLMWQKAQIYLD